MMRYKPMLAQLGSKELLDRKTVGFIFEPKLDGTRVLIYKGGDNIQLINRRDKDITFRYPELLDIVNQIKANSCVLDAELVVLDKENKPNFNLLQQREQLDNKFMIDLRSKEIPATLFVFDILELENKPLIDKFLRERKLLLQKIIVENSLIAICPWTANGKALWEKVKEQGLEGIMAKEVNSKYEQKRSWAWLKIKNINTIDAAIIGFTPGEGIRASTFGSLVVAVYNPEMQEWKCIGKLGTGFDQKMLKYLTKKMKKLKIENSVLSEEEQKKINENVTWIKPELVVEVQYLELTKNNELRAPTFLRLRFDKKPEECVL
ncbi:MAG: non-homologous end-joining DNA ligase [Candidatus Pacearchaeota archaeon]